jgi:hypothetical protein
MLAEGAFVGAGFFAGTVVANFVAGAIGYRSPFLAGIRIIIAALLPAVARANSLAVDRTIVGAFGAEIARVVDYSGYVSHIFSIVRVIYINPT